MIGKITTIVLIAIISIAVFFTLQMYIYTYEIEGTVLHKHIDFGSDGSYYVVVLTNGQTLEVDRNIFFLDHKYNPDLVYASIVENQTYTFTCWGWINEWFYWYPNVIAIE